MSVPAIAFYASPTSSMCSTTHQSSNVSSQGSLDFDVNSRPSSSSASPSVIPKQPMGGLSRMFSSSLPIKHSPVSSNFSSGDGLASLLHERSDDLSCSYSYSSYPASLKSRDHSPVSVMHGPVSRGGTGTLRGFRESSDLKSGRDRLFKRFVTNALGLCLDYDSPSLPVIEGSRIGFDEFVFAMEDNSAEIDGSCMPYAQAILLNAQSRHKIFKEEFVIKAFYEAERAHRGQMRASGDHYLQHCVETSVLLASIGANATVVAAGLLHDTLDDSFMDQGYLSRTFGKGVVDLVKGVSKLSHLSKLARDNNTASKTAEADKLHTMFLGMADARAVLIKLADRLHNMMTLDALPMIKRQRFAKETLEIFAPLANRLGIFSWKEQLENLCFKHLNPEQYEYLSFNLLKTFDEAVIASAKEKLEQVLLKEGLIYHVLYGRHKSLYSIYSKMHKKNLTMNEIHDIHGLRLIVDNEDDCYKALDVVHRLWPNVMGRYKDYIKNSKDNGYQSLHTVVLSEGGVPLEVQIRTKEMHLQAEFGFAAHWRYKEGGCKHASFVRQMVEWARWVLTWHCETMSRDRSLSFADGDSICPPCSFPCHADSCPFSYTPQGQHDGPVFVILLENEKMSVQELSANSTLRDLYNRISWGSSRWGARSYPTKEELRAKLNHEVVVDPNRKLKMGDVVELLHKSLTEYREEIRRMYDGGFAVSVGSDTPDYKKLSIINCTL